MLQKIFVAVFLVAVSALLLLGADAGPKQLVATGKLVPTVIDNYGEFTCVGGERVAGHDLPWDPLACSPETTHIRARGLVRRWEYYDQEGTGANLLWGVRTTVENYNINPKTGVFAGWGTLEVTIYDCPYPYACAKVVGTWEGSWSSGSFSSKSEQVCLTFTLHGSGGLEGLEMKGEECEGEDYNYVTVRIQPVAPK